MFLVGVEQIVLLMGQRAINPHQIYQLVLGCKDLQTSHLERFLVLCQPWIFRVQVYSTPDFKTYGAVSLGKVICWHNNG